MPKNDKTFFTKNRPLLDVYEKVVSKNLLVDDWEEVEVNNSFLPADSFYSKDGEYKRGRTPVVFSLYSIVVIVLMIATILPAILFGYFVVSAYLRRAKKLKQIRELQYEIRSTFPRIFDPEHDILTYEEIAIFKTLQKEHVVATVYSADSAICCEGKLAKLEA